MSQYDKLDSLIVEAIKDGCNTFDKLWSGVVGAEAKRLYEEDLKLRGYKAKPAFRFIDNRLQALRKRGVIVHVTGWGWRVKEVA